MEFTAIRASTAAGEHERIGGGGCPSSPDQVSAAAVEKEHMFDKVVTPSDVGKLNRLVIPKQHAEKYFPLDASSTDKGLLLSFEDRAGKPWRFRYSYWNSSQSYVMTKGWSRFVKEKRLDAGDTVSFGRGVGEAARDRLFIDWRRRPDVATAPLAHHRGHFTLPSVPFAPWTTHYPVGVGGGGRMFMPAPSPVSVYDYDAHHHHHSRRHVGYEAAAGRQVLFYRPQQQYHHQSVVLDSVPVRMVAAQGHPEPSLATSGTKRVRLFGVNLDCATNDEEDFAAAAGRMAPPSLQLLSPASSSSSSSGKARCSLNLDL